MKATNTDKNFELNIKPIQKLKLIMISIPGEVITDLLPGSKSQTALVGNTGSTLRPEDVAPRKAEIVLEQVGYQNDTTKQ